MLEILKFFLLIFCPLHIDIYILDIYTFKNLKILSKYIL